jgi:sugar lactone lactonase YvrE
VNELISYTCGGNANSRSSIAFYPNGDAVVSANNTGRIYNVIGGTISDFTSGLSGPTGIVFDSKWNMYVLETSGNCIRRYGPTPNYNTNVVIAGTANASPDITREPYFTLVTGYIASNILYVNSFTNAASLANPIRVGLNIVSNSFSHGTISSFGANTIGGIGTYNLIGNSNDVGSIGSPQTITVFGRGGPTKGSQAKFNRPSGITIDKNDIIYITDNANHCILRIYLNPNSDPTVADNWTVETIAGGWNAGSKTYGNQTGTTDNVSGDTALFNYPLDITVDPTSKFLYVIDTGNNSIRKIDISTRIVSTCPNITITGRSITCDEFGILYVATGNYSSIN